MISKKDKINQFKRELKSIHYYEESIKEINFKLIEIDNKLQGVSSPKIKEVLIENGRDPYSNNKIELLINEEKLCNEKTYYINKLNYINDALNSCSKRDMRIIKSLYTGNGNYEEIAFKEGFSPRSLKYHIDSVILKIS